MKTSKLAVMLGALLLSQQGYSANTDLDKTVVKPEQQATTEIDIIDSIKIDQTGVNNITDIVRHIPGVQVNDTGDRFNDSGFNIRGVEGDAVAITVDGLAQGEVLSPPSFSPYGMFGSNRSIIDTETVKEIRIVKGPNSVLAGSGALGGSVALTTKDPQDFLDTNSGDQTGGKVKLGYDSRSEETLVSGAIANRTGALDSLLMYVIRDGNETQSYSDGGVKLGSGRESADPFDRDATSILAKLVYNISDDQRIGVVYEDGERETDGTPLSRDSSNYYDFFTNDESNRKRVGVFYNLDAETIAFDKLSINVDKQTMYNSGITAFSYDSDSDRSNDILRMEDRRFEQDTIDAGIDLEKLLGARDQHTIVYGLAYRKTEVSNELYDRRFATTSLGSRVTENTQDPSWVPETDKSLWSVYALDRFELNDWMTINAGIRYESTQYEPRVDDSFQDPLGVSVLDSEFDALTSQLGVDFQITEHQTIGLLYAQGYKAPTTQDLYLDVSSIEDGYVDVLTGQTFDDWERVANPDLDAEKASSIELSYTWRSEKAFIKLNAFVVEYTNQIQAVTKSRGFGQTIEVVQPCSPRAGCDPANPPPNLVLREDSYDQVDNVGETTVKGIELESQFSLTDNWRLMFSASHVEGEHDTSRADLFAKGDELATVSPDSATLGLDYTPDSQRWGVASTLVWTDARDESSELSFTSLNNGGGPVAYTDSYVVLDLSAYYKITDSFSLTANIYNVTDKEYTRWEVINNVRPGTGGFFSGTSGDGANRFTEPGRSFAVYASYSF